MPESMCAVADGIEVCYECFGDPEDPALLLIMGLGTQMLAWHEAFCEELAGRGFHVIRFDNRDCGRSTSMQGRPPTMLQLLLRDRNAAVYHLEDMANDAVALLDHLGVEKAHVVGASMGGMIAQTVAGQHPERVLSLVSIMSNAGGRFAGQPMPSAVPLLLRRAPGHREGYVEHLVKAFEEIGSPGFERAEHELREFAGRAFDRGVNRAGTARQLAAILASGDRSAMLRTIKVPTLVIHGAQDKLVHPSGGRATARAIPGARLMMIDGMGHDLPRGVWPRVIEGIAETAARAGVPAHAH